MKKLICLALILSTTGIHSSSKGSNHPKTGLFYLGTPATKTELTAKEANICIIVPGLAKDMDTKTLATLKGFSQTLTIPMGYFGPNMPTTNLKPICLYFSWIDKNEGAKNLRNEAETLAKNLNQLKKDAPNASITLIALGRGGLLANAATQVNGFPNVDSIIQLGTPIPSESQKLYPKTGKYNYVFNLQTALPYPFLNPSLGQEDLKAYPSSKTFKPYNIRVIHDGKQISFQKEILAAPFKKSFKALGLNLFGLCQELKTAFPTYRNVWTSIDTTTPTRRYTGLLKTKNYTVKPTASELAKHAVAKTAFEKTYNETLQKALAAPVGKTLRSTYKAAKTNNRFLQKFACQTT